MVIRAVANFCLLFVTLLSLCVVGNETVSVFILPILTWVKSTLRLVLETSAALSVSKFLFSVCSFEVSLTFFFFLKKIKKYIDFPWICVAM